jgi:hypothetical protein
MEMSGSPLVPTYFKKSYYMEPVFVEGPMHALKLIQAKLFSLCKYTYIICFSFW